MRAEVQHHSHNTATKQHIAEYLCRRGEEISADAITLVRMKPFEYTIVAQSDVGTRLGILNSQHPNSVRNEFHIGKSQYGVCLRAEGNYDQSREPLIAEDMPIVVLRLDAVVLDIPTNLMPSAEVLGVDRLVLGGYDSVHEFLVKKYEGVLGNPLDELPYYIRQFTVVDRFTLGNDD